MNQPGLLFYVTLCMLLFLNLEIAAQTNTSVVGQVSAKDGQAPVPFASVKILSAKGEFITGSITLEDGNFKIVGLAPGNYTLNISCLGYQAYELDLYIGELNDNYDLGNILLEAKVLEVDEVEILGDRSEVVADLGKKTYDISNNVAQAGGSVMDAMKSMPSVSFDQEGKVILRGSDKVIVLVNGKPSSLAGVGSQRGLDNIPAANIEKIEIINNPSAKYDANGMAGIINIIYKKEKQEGINGKIGFNYGLGALSKARQDLPTDLGSFSPTPKYIPSLDLQVKKDKLAFSLQSQVLFQKQLPNNEFTTRTYSDGRIIASQVPENRRQTRYIIQGGIDYALAENSSLSFSGLFDWEQHVDSAQVPYINLNNNIRNRYIAWNEEEITGYMNYSLLYEKKFKQEGHLFTAQTQYIRGWEDETYFINDSSQIRTRGRDVTNVLGVENIYSLSLDYSKPLRWGRLETGSKLQVRNLPVEYVQDRGENSILYEGLGNFSEWGERIYAAYVNWIQERKSYTIEGGLRGEYTSVFYEMDPSNSYYQDNDAYDYFRVFPNIRLSAKLNEHNRFSLFYNYRVDRPGEPQLRMYAKSDDHELVKVGNPYLRPQFTQSFELAYKTDWGSGSAFISGYYRIIEDPYMRVYTQDTSNLDFDVVLKSYANTGEARNQGIEFILDQRLSRQWKFSMNFNFYQNKIVDFEGNLLFPYAHSFSVKESQENTFDTKIINTFNLKNGLEFQLSALYFAPRNTPQGRQLERSSIDFGIKQKLWEGRGELSFSFSDIFNDFAIRETLTGDGFTAFYGNYYETQVLRLGLTYKF